VPRPKLRTTDRLFWVALARVWAGWRLPLVIVTPDTILRWQRRRLRVQDRRTPHSVCPVLHPAARGKLLDGEPLSADSRAHRATRVASDLSRSNAPGARAMKSGRRTGGGSPEWDSRRGQARKRSVHGGPCVARGARVDRVGKEGRVDRGPVGPFQATRRGGNGSISKIPDKGPLCSLCASPSRLSSNRE